MFLLEVTCIQLIYIESYLPLCMCWVLYLSYVCICCAYYFLILSNQVYACWFAHHVRLFLLSLLHIVYILLALVRD
jgi:hypothetical protein